MLWAEEGGSCALKSPRLVGPTRCTPERCEAFTISSSPGVSVDLHGTLPGTGQEGTAVTRWPLSNPTDVLVKMTCPSSASDGDQVRWGGATSGGGGRPPDAGVSWARSPGEGVPGPLLTRMQAQARLSPPHLLTAPGWLPNKLPLKSGSKVLAAKRR